MTSIKTADSTAYEADRVFQQPPLAALCAALEHVLGVAPTLPAQVALRWGDASLEVDWPITPAPTAPAAADSGPASDTAGRLTDDQFLLSAPLVGTVYRCPEPGSPAFVEINDVVEPGQQVAIIEAMKLMNAIVADRAGRVADILIADGAMVEYGQTLFVLESVEED